MRLQKFGHVPIAHLNSLLYANSSYAFHALNKANKQENFSKRDGLSYSTSKKQRNKEKCHYL